MAAGVRAGVPARPGTAPSAWTGRTAAVADLAPFTALGLAAEESSVMTADAGARAPAAQHRGDVPAAGLGRRLGTAGRGRPRPARTVGYDLPFVTARTRAERRLVEAGYGAWWGAFEGDRLLASMGLFTASEGLARFQIGEDPSGRPRPRAGRHAGPPRQPLRLRGARCPHPRDGRGPRLPGDPDLPVRRVRRHRAAAAGGAEAFDVVT